MTHSAIKVEQDKETGKMRRNRERGARECEGGSYIVIPPMATMTPETNQPRATMVQVFKWPTTVLDTAPVCAMMKNWEMLMREAKRPDWVRKRQHTV